MPQNSSKWPNEPGEMFREMNSFLREVTSERAGKKHAGETLQVNIQKFELKKQMFRELNNRYER